MAGSIAAKYKLGLSYPIINDYEKIIIDYFGLNNPTDAKSYPALFAIGDDLTIQWSYIGKDYDDRPNITEALTYLKK